MSNVVIDHSASPILDSLYALSSRIVKGATLEESLEFVFDSFQDLVPYDRIGYAEIDIAHQTATSRWAMSRGTVLLRVGYTAPLAGSSLSIVLEQRQPRILNNLPRYLEIRPNSRSTRLIVGEGIQSSMTCPLFANDEPLGFLFFSSVSVDAYTDLHVKLLKEVSNQLALLLLLSKKTLVTFPPPNSKVKPSPEIKERSLSQLRPGMLLESPLFLDNGTLLLGSGVTLTEQAIDRLVVLHTKGFMRINSVRVL